WRYAPGQPPRLLASAPLPSVAADAYAVAIEADGPAIRLFVEGREIAATRTDGPLWGRLQLAAAGGGPAPAEARFQDLVVRRLPIAGNTIAGTLASGEHLRR